jgi:hypothetical protein
MAVPEEISSQLQCRFSVLLPHLNERQQRLALATEARLLTQEGFSLQANVKTLEGARHPDRDAQFRYINEQVKQHQDDGEPVISVDTKKREQIGRLPVAGREWRPRGEPVEVEDQGGRSRSRRKPEQGEPARSSSKQCHIYLRRPGIAVTTPSSPATSRTSCRTSACSRAIARALRIHRY